MSVVRNAHRRELYNCKRRAGWRGGNLRERKEEGREGGREADIFPLHACSCSDQLEYFSQLFQRQPTLSLKDGRRVRGGKKWKVLFSSNAFLSQSHSTTKWFSTHWPFQSATEGNFVKSGYRLHIRQQLSNVVAVFFSLLPWCGKKKSLCTCHMYKSCDCPICLCTRPPLGGHTRGADQHSLWPVICVTVHLHLVVLVIKCFTFYLQLAGFGAKYGPCFCDVLMILR